MRDAGMDEVREGLDEEKASVYLLLLYFIKNYLEASPDWFALQHTRCAKCGEGCPT